MEARFLLGAIRRSLLLILLLAVAGGGIGAWLGVSASLRYQATASIAVFPPDLSSLTGSQSTETATSYVPTQVGVIDGNTVLDAVAGQAGMKRSAVEKALNVSQQQTSDIIDITATAASPASAASLANLVANTYMQQITASVDQLINTTRTNLQNQLSAYRQSLESTTNSTQINYYQALIGPLAQSLTNLETLSPAALIHTQIVSTATPPASPMPRYTSVKGALGLLAGLALGVVVAVLVAAIRPRMLRSTDVEQAIGVSTAAELPHVAEWKGLDQPEPAGATEEWSNTLDWKDHPIYALEVAKIAVFVEAARSARNCKTVLVTSLERSAGVSTLAAALAAALRDGNRVVRLVGLPGPDDEAEERRQPEGDATLTGVGLQGRIPSPIGQSRATGGFVRRERKFQLSADDFDADVLVLDGGSLSDTASVVSVARSSDVTVLVVPLPNDNERYLHAVTRATFSDARGQLLVVTNNVVPARGRRRAARG